MHSIILALVACFISTSSLAEEFVYEKPQQQEQTIVMDKQQLAELVVEKSHMMDALSIIIDSMRENSTDIVFSDSVLAVNKDLYLKNASQLLASQFSEGELQALLNFYSTEEGASIAVKMPYFQAAMGKILENMIVSESKELSLE